MVDLCRLFGLSRQSYYKFINKRTEDTWMNAKVISMVESIRSVHPRMGGRKIYSLLQTEFKRQDIKIGRDKLFNLLADNQLLIKKRKRKIYTTNSYHHFHKYPNLIKEFRPYQANQLWVSDITYVKTGQQFSYLFLVTDAYSRRIMGYAVSKNLESQYAVKALKMAIKYAGNVTGLIHHSDRGIQYCSKEYVNLCQDNNIKLSMTEDGNPRDNGIAERVNGILKDEYIYEARPSTYLQFKEVMESIIYKYNQLRPHLSCDMNTPNKTYLLQGKVNQRWKNYYFNT